MKVIRTLSTMLTILFVILLSGAHAASFVVDLDAQKNVRPNLPEPIWSTPNDIVLTLDAGEWTVSPFAGTYTAWNNWSGGPPSHSGWLSQYSIDIGNNGFSQADGDIGDPAQGSSGFFSTPQEALANAQSVTFTLANATSVAFFLAADSVPGDNLGGLSLQVTSTVPSPEPSTLIGLVSILGVGMCFLQRRGKKGKEIV